MKRAPFSLEIQESDEQFDLKHTISKYGRYWVWFISGLIVCIGIAYLYLMFAPNVYESVAKIKILDETKRFDISTDPLKSTNSHVNIDNEIEVLQSYRLLSEVVKELNYDVSYFTTVGLKSKEIWNAPFEVTKNYYGDSLTEVLKYEVVLTGSDFKITDAEGKSYNSNANASNPLLPFSIKFQDGFDKKQFENSKFRVELYPVKDAVMQLASDMKTKATNKNSDIISLSLRGQNPGLNEKILNGLIDKYNEDGIEDRQLISKRTVDFIDERFVNLSGELNMIEGEKEVFKETSNLSYIEADAGMSMQKKAVAEDEVNKLQTQISLSGLLKESLSDEDDFALLPADIGLESGGINNLVANYNQTALKRQKLIKSAGENNPSLQSLSDELKRGRQNVLQTLNVYQQQLGVSLSQLTRQKNIAGAQFSRIPEKEKILRSIERQQSIKENLYLLLLQKREEAAINYAVTAPSIKVVDFALTDNKPVSPNKPLIYGISMLFGLLMPFGFLYTRFTLDSKIRERADVEKLNLGIPIAAEMPFFGGEKIFIQNDNSMLAESFRILGTNINYLLPKKEKSIGQIIYVTSSVKGEGKTLTAINLSLAYASLKKKVLLVGADFRNPKLHEYFKQEKNMMGLSNYLYEPTTDWRSFLYQESEFHSILFSGAVPPNAPALLSKEEFEEVISQAKQEYDYIIVDTAPALVVTDTLLISQYADLTLMIIRAGYSDKRLLEFSKQLSQTKKLKNMVYVLNDLPIQNINGYNYGYNYGYVAAENKPWYRSLLG